MREWKGVGVAAKALMRVFQAKRGGRVGREWKKEAAKGREMVEDCKRNWEMKKGWWSREVLRKRA